MKKLIILSYLVLAAHMSSAVEPLATLSMSIGDVMVKRQKSVNWLVIPIGKHIYEGDKIRTKETGKAEVLFYDGSVIFLGPDTEIEFIKDMQMNENKKKNSIFLFFGSMWNKVTTGTQFEVESIHALATVKGTEFSVNVKDVMDVYVTEGVVEVANQFGKKEATKGTRTTVSKDTQPIQTKVEKDEMPAEPEISSSKVLETSYASIMYQNQWYKVQGSIKDKETSTIIKDTAEIKVDASDTLYLSTDGSSKLKSLSFNVTEGTFSFYVLSSSDTDYISFTSPSIPSQTDTFKFKSELTQKDVLIEFTNQDGQNRKIQASFKKE